MHRYLLLIIIVFISCKNEPRTSSARNAQSKEEAQKQYLLEMNQDLVAQQDSLFKQIVNASSENWKKSEKGYYYCFDQTDNDLKVEPGSIVRLWYVVKELQDVPVDTFISTFAAGKSQDMPLGIQDAVLKLNMGSRGSLLLPFRMAYGVKGIPEKILPYQPVRVDFEILNVEKR